MPTVSSATITATDSGGSAKTSTLAVGDKVVVTVKMSEATTVTGTPTYTIDVGGASKTASYTSGTGSDTLVFSYTVASGDEDSAGGITAGTSALTLANSSTLKDAAGNNATLTTPAAAANTLAVDTAAPTVSSATITATDASNAAKTSTLSAGDKLVVTVKMSEATTVTGTPTYTIDVGGVSKTASYTSGTGTDTLVFSYTVASGDEDSAGGITAGTSALILANSSTLKDAAGNNASLTTPLAATNTLAVDAVAPTTSLLSGNISPASNLTMTFAEDVVKGTGNITILNSTNTSAPSVVIDVTSNQVSIDVTKKIITINPTDDLTAGDSYYVQIDTGALRDSTGNSYAGISDTSSWVFTAAALTTDAVWSNGSTAVSTNGINATELSSLSIAGTLSNQNNTATGVTITSIVFKAASGSAGDVSYSGTMPTVSDTNGSTWTLASTAVPTLVNGESYTIKVGLSADGGITGTGGNSNSVAIDTTLPTIAIASDKSSLKAGETATITFTLSEVSTDFAVGDVTATGGALSGFALKSGETKVYTATFTPTTSSTTAGAISVANSKFTDAAGNNNADGSDADNSVALSIDTVPPTIAIASDKSGLKAGETATITFTLSEVSTDFAVGDVTATGGALSGFALKSGETKVYTATFTPTAGGSSGSVSVASSKFSDAAGNNNADGSDADNSVSPCQRLTQCRQPLQLPVIRAV